jgi:hypothetical protein
LTAVDREALQRGLELMRAESEQERERIERELAQYGWRHAAETAVYHCQDSRLHLRPWQPPPCWLRTDEDVQAGLAQPFGVDGRRAAAELVQRLLAAGLSRYEPDPVGALAALEAV